MSLLRCGRWGLAAAVLVLATVQTAATPASGEARARPAPAESANERAPRQFVPVHPRRGEHRLPTLAGEVPADPADSGFQADERPSEYVPVQPRGVWGSPESGASRSTSPQPADRIDRPELDVWMRGSGDLLFAD